MIFFDSILKKLKGTAREGPVDLHLAWQEWAALGAMRDGSHLVVLFADLAKASPDGAIAFAKAYHELARDSGEGPRSSYVTKEVLTAIEEAKNEAKDEELEVLNWFTESLRKKVFDF